MKRRDVEYTQVMSHMFIVNAAEVLLVIFDLGRHIRAETGEKPYTCDICKKMYSRQSNVALQRRIYTGEK